ncbi:GTPase HflX [candidate division WOR-3 bacterium]|uniref:GTPase HflX n=1 Tax=candidate division WOR-3 bacterium TaxID=2052148 RepID=A0A660SIG0_UNCW3|nr:MAG: GTPase HflX [candidate division WOR-3 bacterium]
MDRRTPEDLREKVILFALIRSPQSRFLAAEALDELKTLTETAGGRVVERLIQIRTRPDPKTLIGSGKMKELARICQEHGIDLVIFNNDLTPSQIGALEEHLPCRVIDRTALILDIFARHARTREAKCQVELAQLQYRLSKLTGRGGELSRLGGGIGTRGPGEKKLEIDRRRIRQRIRYLKRRLKSIERSRLVQRKRRRNLFKVAIVGYTNAGKSTLLNRLARERVKVSNQLFTTLDSITASVYIRDGFKIILSDTVGFIRNLPHQLIASFRATLSVVGEADLLIILTDLSDRDWEEKVDCVRRVLAEIGADQKPFLPVFNKIDLVFEPLEFKRARRIFPNAVFISALKGDGIEGLKLTLKELAQKEVKYGQKEEPQLCWPSLYR